MPRLNFDHRPEMAIKVDYTPFVNPFTRLPKKLDHSLSLCQALYLADCRCSLARHSQPSQLELFAPTWKFGSRRALRHKCDRQLSPCRTLQTRRHPRVSLQGPGFPTHEEMKYPHSSLNKALDKPIDLQ